MLLSKEVKSLTPRDYLNLIRFYPVWSHYLKSKIKNNKTPLEDGIPWIGFGAIDFLNKHLSEKDVVFEYGAGGSTIFFAKRVKQVISVEHDMAWYDSVVLKLNNEALSNVAIFCIQAEETISNSSRDPSSYSNFYSSHGLQFQKYVSFIDSYPDNYFDWVVVDGRARPSCLNQAQSKVKPGKYLLLDNSDRSHYQPAISNLFGKWKNLTFKGPVPYWPYFFATSIWQKPV